MDQFSMMIQAAIAGLGIALLPDYLAQNEISEGRLVPVFEQAVPLREAYWLVWPKRKEGDVPLRVFRSWLERCCRGNSDPAVQEPASRTELLGIAIPGKNL